MLSYLLKIAPDKKYSKLLFKKNLNKNFNIIFVQIFLWEKPGFLDHAMRSGSNKVTLDQKL